MVRLNDVTYWQPLGIGNGLVSLKDRPLTMTVFPDAEGRYHDAQITDYRGLPRRDFPWRPPLRMTVRARTSHADIQGTAGFGFWNRPFVPLNEALPQLPRAVWFFYGSPPNNMALAQGVRGYGWKAATIDTQTLPFLLLAPFAPLGFLLMRIPFLYRVLWPIAQRAINVSEALLDVPIDEWHTYTLIWQHHEVTFWFDEHMVHRARVSIGAPLGFIAWIDNQYAIVTPQGNFGFGTLNLEKEQSLLLDALEITHL